MSPKSKSKTFPAVRVTDKLLEDTIKCATDADEYLSDYIRKAVEMRNAQQPKTTNEKREELKRIYNPPKTEELQPAEPVEISKPLTPKIVNSVEDVRKVIKPKNDMINTYFKK